MNLKGQQAEMPWLDAVLSRAQLAIAQVKRDLTDDLFHRLTADGTQLLPLLRNSKVAKERQRLLESKSALDEALNMPNDVKFV